MKDNKGIAAVYRLINNINNKTYVGSTVNLSTRFYKYFSIKHLTERKTPIHNALLKYGFENFTLEILEYCESGIDPTKREQYYFTELKPDYNILELAGSSLGYKHTSATLELFKEREVNEETRKNLSLAATGRVRRRPPPGGGGAMLNIPPPRRGGGKFLRKKTRKRYLTLVKESHFQRKLVLKYLLQL